MPNQELQWEKRWLLLVIAGVCLYLYWQGSEHIPYHQYLATLGSGLYALNFLTILAK